MRDEEELPLRGLDPGVEDGLAFGERAADAFARRARDVDPRDLLPNKHGGLLRNDIEVDRPVRVEARVRRRDESLQFLYLHVIPLCW